jgi:glycosyltransferase involved in cell wall biosynthesis
VKVLFAIKAMNGARGGAERVLATVTRGLVDLGCEVTLLTHDQDTANSVFPLHPSLERVCLPIGDARTTTGPVDLLRRLPALRRSVLDARPDVAVGFMHSMFVPLAFALAGTGVPVVASEHTPIEHYRTRPAQFGLLRASAGVVRIYTVMTEALRASYPPSIRNKMVILPNPVQAPSVAAEPGGEQKATKTLLSVGRFSEEKGHLVLVDSFARIAGEFPDWELRFVGDGVLLPELQRRVQTLGLSTRVHFPGSTAEVEREYAAAQVLVTPSRYESFGLVTAEAMSAGLPVIGFADCPGTNELIEHGKNGLLVRGDDRAGGLTSAMRRLMSSADLRVRLGAAGPASTKRFQPDVIVGRWKALLDQVSRG